HRLDLKSRRHKRFHRTETSVLPERFQIIQNKKCILLRNIFLYGGDHFFKGISRFLAFLNLQPDQGLAYRSRSGIKYIYLLIRLLLMEKIPTQNGAVIGAAQFRRKSNG